ncbi:type I restriction modification DNA specificity domain protein [Leptospira sp. P2653]|nr:type I restriction modification DNA specificity domain protein [Leptospira sp. P2653]
MSFDDKIINPKFYWHFAQSDLFWSQANRLVSGGGQPQFNANALKEVIIPIPPLAAQEEIVRILDAFTELTTELASELSARKKQYNYYRDQLLSFDEGEVEWKTLGETCDVYTGGEAPESSSMSKTPTDIYKYPIFGNGAEVYGYTDRYRIDKDAVTISSIGANTGTIYFRKAHFTPIIRLKVVIPKQEGILPRYLFHALSSIAIGSKSSSVPNMNAADVKRISIPVHSINNQERIVRILDKFDALTNSISEGLPREITLRQKQYEYYRELLLSFPKAEVDPK